MKKPVVASTVAGLLAASALWLPAQGAVDFAKDVAPVLQARCLGCHGPEKQKGKLRLDAKAQLPDGGSGGEVIRAGDASGSELIKRIVLPPDSDERMPPQGEPLTAKQVSLLTEWIATGAAWPDNFVIELASAASASTEPSAPPANAKPAVPPPVLPDNFQPSSAEAGAIEHLAQAGIPVRPVAQNLPWHEVNLRPTGATVSDEALQSLKAVTSLIEVRLGGTQVTDDGLAFLKSLPHLQVLGLELTQVTDAGIAHLEGLSNLTYLNLYGTGVTDAALKHLEGMKHLKNLYLWQTKVTPDGVGRLQEALPGLDINTGVDLSASSTNAAAEKSDEVKK